jgi:ubiquinone/menaquinone biosynthesis C-methylase UbiE
MTIRDSKYLDFLSKFGVGSAHPGGFNLTKEILSIENINRTSQVLDVGCGTGQTAAYIASRYGASVTGMDINPIMVEKARKRISKEKLPVNITQGSIESCALKDQHFDFVLSESVLAFVHVPKALSEIFRLLKKGGRMIAIELTLNYPLSLSGMDEITKFYGFNSVLKEKEWGALLTQAGFKDILIRRNNPPFLANQTNQEFHFSKFIETELYTIMPQHFSLMQKYQGIIDYRIITCTK